jgi:hypothetical protein
MIIIKRKDVIIFLLVLLFIALVTQFYKEEIQQLLFLIKNLL